jgi:hypothetical protein
MDKGEEKFLNQQKINEINERINNLTEEIKILKLELRKYVKYPSHKKYYENNIDTVKESQKKYMLKLKEENPEKLKEWRHLAYLKRKEKLKNNKQNN